MVEVNEEAPNFETTIARGGGSLGEFKLEEVLGDGPVVLMFFPSAFSPGCTMEVCEFRDSYGEFEELGATVIGISTDMPYALDAFVEENDLEYPLASDFNREIIADYGVKIDELAGLEGVAERSVFVLDSDGVVRWKWVGENAADLPDVEEVRDAVSEAR